MRVAHRSSRGGQLELYVCSRDIRTTDCTHPSISVKNLDAEVRAFVGERLTKRERVERHVERMLAEDSTAGDVDAVERAIAEVERKRGNLARRLALFDDDQSAAPIVAELSQLGKRRSALDQERDAVLGRQRRLEDARQTLASIAEWCEAVAERVETLTYAQWRELFDIIGLRVRAWGRGTSPRWVIDVDPAFASTTST